MKIQRFENIEVFTGGSVVKQHHIQNSFKEFSFGEDTNYSWGLWKWRQPN